MNAFADLQKEFPRELIHWRAQSLTKRGDKARALAYIDARDVMRRLDDVVGPENWQDKYTETGRGRIICSIGIFTHDQWIWKSDGAGETDFEGEKGAISDAFKRSGVKWGIGRYLYDLDAPWVPCTTYENHAGKKVFKAWREDPWSYVNQPPAIDLTPDKEKATAINDIRNVVNLEDLRVLWADMSDFLKKDLDVYAEKESRKSELASQQFHQGAG